MVVLVDERPGRGDRHAALGSRARSSPRPSTAPPRTTPRSPNSPSSGPKRLVELGHDVVVLLDSMTRLGSRLQPLRTGRPAASCPAVSTRLRSTRRSASSAPRATSSTAASLTILATALVETGLEGRRGDLRGVQGHRQTWSSSFDRRLADKRIFPAVDIDASSTPARGDPARRRGTGRHVAPAAGCCTTWTSSRPWRLLITQMRKDEVQRRAADADPEEHPGPGRRVVAPRVVRRRET